MATIIRKFIEAYKYVFIEIPELLSFDMDIRNLQFVRRLSIGILLRFLFTSQSWDFGLLVYLDQRTKDWFLLGKPYQGLTLLALYLLFIFKWGPKLMKDRPPFNLDKIMIVYNLIQIISCAYIFICGVIKWTNESKLFCEPVDFSVSEKSLRDVRLVYFYFILKIMDLADTIFFVLRKKFEQISFLHVYHHTGMVMMIWGAATYQPGGHGASVGIVNSFVHVVMYSYYLLTLVKPSMKKSVAIKKFVTQIQILQFLILSLHMGSLVFIPDCAYPRWISALFLPQNLFMLILFIDFYIKTYIRKPKKSAQSKKIDEGNRENADTPQKNGSFEHLSEDKLAVDSKVILRNRYKQSVE